MIVFLDSATLVTVYINRNNFVVHCYLDNQYKIYLQGDPEITVKRVRGSRAEIIFKKAVPENATKITGKHLYQSLFFNKNAGFPLETFFYPLTFSGSIEMRPATLWKKRLRHKCFPVKFVKLLKTLFFIELLWWLLRKK